MDALREFEPDDRDAIERYAAVDNAVRTSTRRGCTPTTSYRVEMLLRHGWDGEPGRRYLVQATATTSASAAVDTTRLRQPRPGVGRRRRSTPSTAAAASARRRCEQRRRRRPGAWAGPSSAPTAGTTSGRGLRRGPRLRAEVARRSTGASTWRELEPGLADRLYDEALAHAGDYELVRIDGPHARTTCSSRSPSATAAINDAPSTTSRSRTRSSPPTGWRRTRKRQLASGFRFYRIIARHRGTGELAGLTVVTVDSEAPRRAHQHDTSVVRAHRGHRLGLLLKADMMRWLARGRAAAGDPRHLERRVQRPHGRRQRAAGLPGDGRASCEYQSRRPI